MGHWQQFKAICHHLKPLLVLEGLFQFVFGLENARKLPETRAFPSVFSFAPRRVKIYIILMQSRWLEVGDLGGKKPYPRQQSVNGQDSKHSSAATTFCGTS